MGNLGEGPEEGNMRMRRVGGALIVGLGLVASVTGPPVTPTAHQADVRLAATVLAMGGLGYETIEPDLIKRVLGGRYADEENLVGLPWPGQLAPFNGTLTLNESVTEGIATMEAAIRSTPGRKIVAGASGSTLVVDEVMLRLADDPAAPPADELSFVVLGDANRGVFKGFRGVTLPIFDYTVPAIPVTRYDVLVITGEYDGMSDWPDRPWNLLAVLNALAGTGMLQQVMPQDVVDALALEALGSVHYDAMFADLSQVPAKNITAEVNTAGGVTTSYLVPTADLPLLRPLAAKGVPQGVIDTLETVLRPVIDSAYIRNDAPARPVRPRPESIGSAATTALAAAGESRSAGPAAGAAGRQVATRHSTARG